MKEKTKGVLLDAAIYALAFGVGAVPFALIENVFAATAAFTAAATAVIYVFTVIFSDVSIYDPYWSVAPPVMQIAVMIKYGLWNVNAWILLALFCVWSARLTANWFVTYKGLGREDWRYAMFREKYPPLVFQLISFTGLLFVPTAVVYAGFVCAIFASRQTALAPLSLVGAAVMLFAVGLELVSDRAIHRFLSEHADEKRTCDVSVWRYSRHPNYLGEISFWTGLFLYFAAACPDIWYMGLGFLLIAALFLIVSIPMMEKHNSARRADYSDYKRRTSMLLLLPNRK